MNERIRELAKQVAKEEGWGVEVWQTTFTENFAKLIVKECANYAFSDDQDNKAMLNHFGVK